MASSIDKGVSGSIINDAVFRPSVDDVAALLRARLYHDGARQPTFNELTRPTGDEVEGLINVAMASVVPRTGTAIDSDDLVVSARQTVALLAAVLVERSYWPEQAVEDGSLASSYEAMFTATMGGLTDSLADVGAGSEARIASVPMTSPTVNAHRDVYGVDPNANLPYPA